MRSSSCAVALLSMFFGFCLGPALAAEEKPTLLDSFRDWHVYSVGAGADRLCYALSQPKQMNPANVTRDAVFFLISTWPGRKVRSEPSVVPGYQYKVGTKVQVQVGSDKFELFTKNDGSAGGAWVGEPAGEKRAGRGKERGPGMSRTGTSSAGTASGGKYFLSRVCAPPDNADS